MTRKEIETKIENLETEKFYLQMKDRWNDRDRELNRKLTNEIRELKKVLENS